VSSSAFDCQGIGSEMKKATSCSKKVFRNFFPFSIKQKKLDFFRAMKKENPLQSQFYLTSTVNKLSFKANQQCVGLTSLTILKVFANI